MAQQTNASDLVRSTNASIDSVEKYTYFDSSKLVL
jgi:hypothetical protein